MKQYDSYKDSGVQWIGKIPSHWEVCRIKDILKQGVDSIKIGPFGSSLTGKVGANLDYKVYGQWNIVGADFSAGTNTVDKSTYDKLSKSYKVVSGDILISMMGTIGKCATIPEGIQDGIMDSHVVKIRPNKDLISNAYFEYYYDKDKSQVIINELQKVKGGSIMDGLNSTTIKGLTILLPPLLEQQAIAAYLDTKCGEIDKAISTQQKRIDLLGELRQNIITHAVTRGINPDAPLKDSGVEWIGDVPEHWKVMKMNHALKSISDVNHYMPDNVPDGYPYIMTGDLKKYVSELDFDNCKQISKEDYKELSVKSKAEKGDVIFARYATIGTVCYVDIDKDFIVSYSCVTIKPKKTYIFGRHFSKCQLKYTRKCRNRLVKFIKSYCTTPRRAT